MCIRDRMARIGHYNDKRSDAKGNEPENVAFGRYAGTDYLLSLIHISEPTRPY